eukprot:TRINITY_DN13256_c0_g1_i2.p2 TRINITY_DN13256_c0_g1~~TRINITY_DN13256_c0_g1_i2.p2  ORF type:complete len:119 (-),score=4.42 TRINITY_DN13256_c0_g1_i2:46-402(-)
MNFTVPRASELKFAIHAATEGYPARLHSEPSVSEIVAHGTSGLKDNENGAIGDESVSVPMIRIGAFAVYTAAGRCSSAHRVMDRIPRQQRLCPWQCVDVGVPVSIEEHTSTTCGRSTN